MARKSHSFRLTVLAATILGISCFGGMVSAQPAPSVEHFDGIYCSGTMPSDFKKNLDELYDEDLQRVRDYNNGKVTNRDKILQSSYYISLLTASGRILYGDTITKTIERIADVLLKDYPELRKELRFYTVKSSEVNAFATGQGMIFVNLGLIAQVEDEAQLAFVLSHEIIHYVRKHNLEIITRKRNQRDTTDRGLNDFLRYHCRSRQMESEADSLGIEMFYKNSPYDKRVTDGIFDVLQYGYLPFDEIYFDTTQFNSPFFKLRRGSFRKTVKPISARDDYNDSLSTHPNLLKRRMATNLQLQSLQGGHHYVVTTSSQFDYIRNLARMECIRMDLAHAEFASAYYNSYVMLKQMPDNDFLRVARAQALYGAAKYRNYASSSDLSSSHDKEGEVQQVYHFMRRAQQNELNIVALREVWKTHLQMPDDSRLVDMAADLARDLKTRNNFQADVFAPTFDTIVNIQDDTTTTNSKYSNVKRQRRQQEKANSYRYAFTDIMIQDTSFYPFLKEWINKDRVQSTMDDGKGIILFDPTYLVLNPKSNQLKIKSSVKHQRSFHDELADIYKKSGLHTVDYSDEALRDNGNTSFYNDFITICEWTNEFWQSEGKIPMLYSTQSHMDSLTQRLNANKLHIPMVVNADYRLNGNKFLNLGGFVLVLTAPEAVYSVFANNEETFIRNQVVNTGNGMLVGTRNVHSKFSDSPAMVKSHTYSQLLDITKPNITPGYMGKHFMVFATGGVSFPIFNHLYERTNTNNFAIRYGGGAEYAIGRQSSIAFAFDHGETVFDMIYESANANVNTFALAYRSYFSGSVAPCGTYFGAGGSLTQAKLQSLTPDGLLHYAPSLKYYAGAHLELGRNYIYYDRIVLNIGVRYNFTVANPFADYYEYQTRVQRALNANIWMYNLLSLHVSLGILPF